MEIWMKIASVIGASILELWMAIPLGFALRLHPVVIAIASAFGSIIAAAVVIFLAKSLRNWLMKRMERKNKKQGRMGRIWEKYGVIGLGLASPLLTGAPLGAAIGVSFGAKPVTLFIWMVIGIVVWSGILTAAVAMGMISLTSFV
ncbi:small multi-drug export protein [Aneurinibacillus aneurinilyticus]|nr:small multi-drug export protein [Aneurinibacillus aneurinilyticus]MCI1694226.1 small multi-drug export protein [Aneurinibacillus aneurinilyticus]MED0671336.1 small multi-drug export protein [Aneurinibacillus aneurinilyticus]MED0707760.1 small multi-drug export protein [Aneurinibacillus aneurinilyticus]MED0722425.1 small multi-drug export protein [Aneurinibacillus aneurinilyticus]MED0733123.1 small multi-drug export protein [Aneurinibacillus aneurinilyticus]